MLVFSEKRKIWLCLWTKDFEHDSLHEVFECSVEVLARIDQDCGGEVLKYCVENHSISFDFIWLVLDKFLSSILFRFPHFKAIRVYGFPGIWEIRCCRKWRLIFLDLLWTRNWKESYFLYSLDARYFQTSYMAYVSRGFCRLLMQDRSLNELWYQCWYRIFRH